jgi:hypothetical protein
MRLALATSPTLLTESLRSLLLPHADVTVVLDATDECFDLALTTSDGPAVRATLVVVLDDRPASRGGGTLHDADGSEVGSLQDLAAVLDLVRQG